MARDAPAQRPAPRRRSKRRLSHRYNFVDQRWPELDISSINFPTRAIVGAFKLELDRRAKGLEKFVRRLLAPDRAFARVAGSLLSAEDLAGRGEDLQSWLAHWLRRQAPEADDESP